MVIKGKIINYWLREDKRKYKEKDRDEYIKGIGLKKWKVKEIVGFKVIFVL